MKTRKLLALLLSLVMAVSLMTTAAMAEETVAKIGENAYTTFDEAITEANKLTGDITVEIYGKVEYASTTENLTGSYDSISFVGKTDDAEISITRAGGGAYLQSSKTVFFTDLILSKANPKWENNAGHMGHFFSIQGGTVTYTDCTFPNGACTSKGTATYERCTFNNDVYYSLWIYDDAIVTVDTCTVNGVRGIKLYCEGDNNNDPEYVLIKNTTFTENLDEKAAVALTYGEKLELIGNTYNNPTPHIELNTTTDSNNNGTVIVAQDAQGNDISAKLTCVANGDPSTAAKNGVLITEADVTTKIYTTVEKAAEDVASGDTVILLHGSTETVALPEGVILDKNNYTAANVTVL
ncbi:MAG: hypothetical protein IJZ13_01290, partial [Clostridia bacterium]|nr:hypothetical protein [Clostridia bacterium]